MKDQKKLDNIYLRMAKIWSENSYCIRRKVGCLVVKDSMIISDGYNGTPSGFPNVGEYSVDPSHEPSHLMPDEFRRDKLTKLAEEGLAIKTYPYVLHAEANALTKLTKSTNSSEGATLYCTDEPCLECSKLIIQSGIKRVVYSREYHTHAGIELLAQAGIEVLQQS